ncbi:hypothetical protein DOTSEDRAFT_79715 [Dothistroma septosporum NZE10]|uniref:Uncharacterized protein n=1 Tax=Dothistroma septosporum (strain NZE10 / CBS 128990) TaxID=675120 RepID=N1PTX5_DOTSN|nr:hypothetical protein DOTSEDRAFT_79715 [Dothistroma septosporum NZE10]
MSHPRSRHHHTHLTRHARQDTRDKTHDTENQHFNQRHPHIIIASKLHLAVSTVSQEFPRPPKVPCTDINRSHDTRRATKFHSLDIQPAPPSHHHRKQTASGGIDGITRVPSSAKSALHRYRPISRHPPRDKVPLTRHLTMGTKPITWPPRGVTPPPKRPKNENKPTSSIIDHTNSGTQPTTSTPVPPAQSQTSQNPSIDWAEKFIETHLTKATVTHGELQSIRHAARVRNMLLTVRAVCESFRAYCPEQYLYKEFCTYMKFAPTSPDFIIPGVLLLDFMNKRGKAPSGINSTFEIQSVDSTGDVYSTLLRGCSADWPRECARRYSGSQGGRLVWQAMSSKAQETLLRAAGGQTGLEISEITYASTVKTSARPEHSNIFFARLHCILQVLESKTVWKMCDQSKILATVPLFWCLLPTNPSVGGDQLSAEVLALLWRVVPRQSRDLLIARFKMHNSKLHGLMQMWYKADLATVENNDAEGNATSSQPEKETAASDEFTDEMEVDSDPERTLAGDIDAAYASLIKDVVQKALVEDIHEGWTGFSKIQDAPYWGELRALGAHILDQLNSPHMRSLLDGMECTDLVKLLAMRRLLQHMSIQDTLGLQNFAKNITIDAEGALFIIPSGRELDPAWLESKEAEILQEEPRSIQDWAQKIGRRIDTSDVAAEFKRAWRETRLGASGKKNSKVTNIKLSGAELHEVVNSRPQSILSPETSSEQNLQHHYLIATVCLAQLWAYLEYRAGPIVQDAAVYHSVTKGWAWFQSQIRLKDMGFSSDDISLLLANDINADSARKALEVAFQDLRICCVDSASLSSINYSMNRPGLTTANVGQPEAGLEKVSKKKGQEMTKAAHSEVKEPDNFMLEGDEVLLRATDHIRKIYCSFVAGSLSFHVPDMGRRLPWQEDTRLSNAGSNELQSLVPQVALRLGLATPGDNASNIIVPRVVPTCMLRLKDQDQESDMSATLLINLTQLRRMLQVSYGHGLASNPIILAAFVRRNSYLWTREVETCILSEVPERELSEGAAGGKNPRRDMLLDIVRCTFGADFAHDMSPRIEEVVIPGACVLSWLVSRRGSERIAKYILEYHASPGKIRNSRFGRDWLKLARHCGAHGLRQAMTGHFPDAGTYQFGPWQAAILSSSHEEIDADIFSELERRTAQHTKLSTLENVVTSRVDTNTNLSQMSRSSTGSHYHSLVRKLVAILIPWRYKSILISETRAGVPFWTFLIPCIRLALMIRPGWLALRHDLDAMLMLVLAKGVLQEQEVITELYSAIGHQHPDVLGFLMRCSFHRRVWAVECPAKCLPESLVHIATDAMQSVHHYCNGQTLNLDGDLTVMNALNKAVNAFAGNVRPWARKERDVGGVSEPASMMSFYWDIIAMDPSASAKLRATDNATHPFVIIAMWMQQHQSEKDQSLEQWYDELIIRSKLPGFSALSDPSLAAFKKTLDTTRKKAKSSNIIPKILSDFYTPLALVQDDWSARAIRYIKAEVKAVEQYREEDPDRNLSTLAPVIYSWSEHSVMFDGKLELTTGTAVDQTKKMDDYSQVRGRLGRFNSPHMPLRTIALDDMSDRALESRLLALVEYQGWLDNNTGLVMSITKCSFRPKDRQDEERCCALHILREVMRYAAVFTCADLPISTWDLLTGVEADVGQPAKEMWIVHGCQTFVQRCKATSLVQACDDLKLVQYAESLKYGATPDQFDEEHDDMGIGEDSEEDDMDIDEDGEEDDMDIDEDGEEDVTTKPALPEVDDRAEGDRTPSDLQGHELRESALTSENSEGPEDGLEYVKKLLINVRFDPSRYANDRGYADQVEVFLSTCQAPFRLSEASSEQRKVLGLVPKELLVHEGDMNDSENRNMDSEGEPEARKPASEFHHKTDEDQVMSNSGEPAVEDLRAGIEDLTRPDSASHSRAQRQESVEFDSIAREIDEEGSVWDEMRHGLEK